MTRFSHDLASLLPGVTKADETRLRKAGFRPVVRWIEGERSSEALKTIEALTRLDRREASSKGVKG